MRIYGDFCRLEHAVSVSASVMSLLLEVSRKTPGIDRHATLVRAFIRASQLVQGIADAELEWRGFDGPSTLQDSGAALLLNMAAMIDLSWRSHFRTGMDLGLLARQLEVLGRAGWIKTRVGEGYAYYALYPESYLEAARNSGLGPKTCVIGIRSIGTGLAALVATALRAKPAITVRPLGHPFDREIHAALDSFHLNTADRSVHFAIVDEGPGLSGSSFASVAKWLCAAGVEVQRLHFFPSHEGEPGEAATTETRHVWQQCQRHPAWPESLFRDRVQEWVESEIGALEGPLEEVPARSPSLRDKRFERRKYLARNVAGTWLVKFAGIDEAGERKLRDAQAIAAGGFGPVTPALCYGFLLQEWVAGEPLSVSPHSRQRFLTFLSSYLAFRAERLNPAGGGALIEELRCMAIENTFRAMGAETSRKVEARLNRLEALRPHIRRTRTDNRLHAWKWLVAGESFLKIDAVDHCEAHDLIGCQDIAWDVAGAIVEHDLTADEIASVSQQLQAAGAHISPELVAAMLPCYLAFQIGMWSTASGPDVGALADRYAQKLSRCLKQ